MTTMTRTRATVVGASTAVVVAVAVAASAIGQSAEPTAGSAKNPKPRAETLDARLVESFGVFRRSKTPADKIPTDKSAGPLDRNHGINPEFSRRAQVGAESVYVTAGNGDVCLRSRVGGDLCTTVPTAVGGEMLSVGICGAGIPAGRISVTGLVPDEATDVRFDDGSKAPVADNVLVAMVDKNAPPNALSFRRADGSQASIPLGIPPDAAKAACSPGG